MLMCVCVPMFVFYVSWVCVCVCVISVPLCLSLCTEWIEEHSSAGAPLANYANNHLETFRDPQVPPPLPPALGVAKREWGYT
jgi:hypothetical protein